LKPTLANGKLIGVLTDKDGKFSVDLAPGIYRFRIGLNLNGIYNYWLTVDEKTSNLKLKLPGPLPTIHGDFDKPLRLDPRA